MGRSGGARKAGSAVCGQSRRSGRTKKPGNLERASMIVAGGGSAFMKSHGTVKPTVKKPEKAAPEKKPVSSLGIEPLTVGNYREQERKKFRKQIIVCQIDEEGTPCENVECDALDISKTGIGFRSKKAIAAGRAVVVVA